MAIGAFAGPAMAAGAGELVSGTTLGTLALTGTAATFTTNFTPGGTATANGLLTATNTAASSTLTVGDAGTGAGHMVKAASGCVGSDNQLTNALTTDVTGTGVTSAGVKSIPAAATPVTVATAGAPIAAAALTTAYSQAIPAAQVMLTGCVFSLTATYTLQ
jgi:hypothetical protein